MTKKSNAKLIATILIVAMLCGTVLALVMMKPEFFSFITNIYQQGGIQGGDQNGDNNGQNGQNNQPYIGTSITLNIPVLQCDREDIVTYTITSDFKNVAVNVECEYVGLIPIVWQKITTVVLNNQGGASINLVHGNAGEWNVRVQHVSTATLSNIDNIVVKGITIYQQNSQCNVGGIYTGQLTGTYKMWVVAVLWKNTTSNAWIWYNFAQTNNIGMIPYGQLQVVIPLGTEGQSKDWIAIIDPNSPMGDNLYEILGEYVDQEEGVPIIPNDALNNAVAQGQFVKSNVLTFTIVP